MEDFLIGELIPKTNPIRFENPNLFFFSDSGAEIQMTAAVSGVVPDDTFTVAQAVMPLGSASSKSFFHSLQVRLTG